MSSNLPIQFLKIFGGVIDLNNFCTMSSKLPLNSSVFFLVFSRFSTQVPGCHFKNVRWFFVSVFIDCLFSTELAFLFLSVFTPFNNTFLVQVKFKSTSIQINFFSNATVLKKKQDHTSLLNNISLDSDNLIYISNST